MRNPKAHTLKTDLTTESAAQYLVFASLLTRRIQESRPGNLLRFDGLYTSKDQNDIGKKFIRFYEDGEVLAVSTDATGATVPQVMSWLTKEGASVQDYPRGTFTRNGKQVRFSTMTKYGEVRYEGEIDGEELKLDVHSLINGRRSRCKYMFERSSG